MLIHTPDTELDPYIARPLADALHAGAAGVQWRDGVDDCEHCDAGMLERDGTRVLQHPILECRYGALSC